MDFKLFSFRHAETILENEFTDQYKEVRDIITSITDSEIKTMFRTIAKNNKSLSTSLNKILKNKFIEKDWTSESKIFKDKEFRRSNTWSLDFAKNDISIEVGFNHGTVAAWNLIKPTIAGELNHVEKEINTKIGIVITATNDLKKAGGFDGAIGTYENYKNYIIALNNILTVPILLIGLEPPSTFDIIQTKNSQNKWIGEIRKF